MFVECPPVGGQGVHRDPTQLPPNARRDCFQTHACKKMRNGKHVKVKNNEAPFNDVMGQRIFLTTPCSLS